MSVGEITSSLQNIAGQQEKIAAQLQQAAMQIKEMAPQLVTGGEHSFFVTGLTVFILACFVGYYVVWRVTPALHSPLMAVTNAVSSVIIVGALLAAGTSELNMSSWMGLGAIVLASINIFGGFIVTERMLQMYKKKTDGKPSAAKAAASERH